MSWKMRTYQSIIIKVEQFASQFTALAESLKKLFVGFLASILSLSMAGNASGEIFSPDIKIRFIIIETYNNKEPLNKTIFETNLSIEARQFEFIDKKTLKIAMAERYYQREINEIVCSMSVGLYISYESELNGYIRNDKWHSCMNKLQSLDDKMLKFKRDHIGISKKYDEKIMKCNEETRLLELEADFPPYKHLIIDGEKPRTYDPKAFLECVRHRENQL